MKKQPRKNPSNPDACPESAPPLFPDPASVPGGPAPTPSHDSVAPILDFAFYGEEDSVKGFARGKLVQHAMPLEGVTRTIVVSLRSGPFQRRTLAQLEVKALLGPCTLAIVHGETRTLADGQSMTVPMGSTFTLHAANKAVLLVTSLADPGLGDDRRGGSELD
jgi:hypothetical protein